ncbi:MAG: zf-HC2 domain-containing protein [Acidobacteriia bacterium]|nr:zf-HC2 domain-containing protein [Terriglobia bacterium]MBV8902540.1 zf-HC2 domain-containing protein [Terriglobia bacterium]
MSCSPFDLRDYFLKELSDPETKQVEVHTKTCAACREELERLRFTEAALVSVGEEEIPQRLAFVSDKIFEPSGFRPVWSAFWGSAARLGFASAAMLSIALIALALSGAARKGQIDAAIDRAVAANEMKLEKRIAAMEQEFDYSRREQLMIERSSYGVRQ